MHKNGQKVYRKLDMKSVNQIQKISEKTTFNVAKLRKLQKGFLSTLSTTESLAILCKL